MPANKLSKSKRVERNENIAGGLRTSCAKSTIAANGVTLKAADAAKLFDEGTKAEKAVTEARAKYLLAVQEAKIVEAKIKPLIQPIKSFVVNTFGERSEVAASFGFWPRKSGKVTAEARAEAVEKSRATRTARGTMGLRQKAAIHGPVGTLPARAQVQASAPAPSQSVAAPAADGTIGPAEPSLTGISH